MNFEEVVIRIGWFYGVFSSILLAKDTQQWTNRLGKVTE